MFNSDREFLFGDNTSPEGDQPIMMQIIRVMMYENRARYQSQQQIQQEMIEQNRKVSKKTFKLMELVVNHNSTGSQDNRNLSTPAPRSSTDHDDRALKIRNAFSSHFANKPFSERFGDNWNRHRERFLKCCKEWSVDEDKYPDYLKETLTEDALNFAAELTKTDPNMYCDRI